MKKKKRKIKIVIAGGGTGGHLYPGIALAEEFKEHGSEVHFVGTNKGIEYHVIPKEGYPLHLIPVKGIKRMGTFTKILGLLILPAAFFKSLWLLMKLRPSIVIGVGGYASGPFVMTAAFFGFKTAILEQNTIPGVTNKMLGKAVKRIYLSFEESSKYFPEKKVVYTGNPVRKSIRDKILSETTLSQDNKGRKNLLVFGGSQGAHTINVKMAEAAGALAKSGISILHQTGKNDASLVEDAYKKAELDAEVKPFIYDMAKAFDWADLIVCRAGATTLAELTIAEKPAILIPFPYATDNHQEHNAISLEKAGGAICLTEKVLTPDLLTEKINNLMNNPGRRREMGVKMGLRSKKNAAGDIMKDLEKMAGVVLEKEN